MADSNDKVYGVRAEGEGFQVIDEAGRVIMICRDVGSANEYAVSLNNAYRKGFKAGYREGKGLT